MPQCSTCLDPLSRLHACLHCVYIGCWRKGHIKDHQKEKRHTFGNKHTKHKQKHTKHVTSRVFLALTFCWLHSNGF